ncbi:unnamed protein product [Spirodela intermedia]|uniref:Uncharacterized protein n=1 Tax=Spirodela intermedia TaxID=51605 RepID=A0A7I8IML0_SPIIN|nr:unnamed protein product [Spirodela intermedia]CAA6659187.1 unnamed protein product [Spirodela intermedia]
MGASTTQPTDRTIHQHHGTLDSDRRNSRTWQPPMEDGISPDNPFRERSRVFRFFNLPISKGRDPIRRFPDRSRWREREVRDRISLGISPWRLLSERFRASRFLRPPKVDDGGGENSSQAVVLKLQLL